MSSEPQTSIFTDEFLDRALDYLRENGASQTFGRKDLEYALSSSLDASLERLRITIGGGATLTQCEMPHNLHMFGGRGKQCAKCDRKYCTTHGVGACPVCGGAVA